MAHERSETKSRGVGPKKHYENVIGQHADRTPGAGRPGTRLKPLFPYEKEEYGSVSEAVEAAQRRSEDFGRIVDESMKRHAEADAMVTDYGVIDQDYIHPREK